jgi:peptide/nickel transport system permease protein
MAQTIVLFTTRVPNVIRVEASLSFLGFGIPPPTPSWGGMLSGMGRYHMYKAPWMVIFPGLALAIVVYGINMFGDAVRDLLDPRLRGGQGGFGAKSYRKSRENLSKPNKKKD